MVSEEAIRERSYEIWQQKGQPEGKALEHWLQAQAELKCEEQRSARLAFRTFDYYMMRYRFEEWQRTVQPKPRISAPPQIVTARRISRDQPPVAA